MTIPVPTIRAMQRGDIPALLILMKELARFEGYLQEFNIREADIVEHGLGENPSFACLVCEAGGELVGYCVCILTAWTYFGRPKLTIKELYVADSHRSLGIGKELFGAAGAMAQELGCAKLDWIVLRNNQRAKDFYASLGGRSEKSWEMWSLQ